MKLSKLFHSLYAVLMFLPVMVIPIFAININQKSVEPISITINESYYENITKFETNDINEYSDLINGNIYKVDISNTTNWQHFYNFLEDNGGMSIIYAYFEDNNGYNIEYTINGTNTSDLMIYVSVDGIVIDPDTDRPHLIGITTNNIYLVSNEWYTYAQDFPEYQPSISASDYLPVESIYHENTPVTYNDTDIGSQFLYSLYIPVKEYFNFGNFFGLSGMYDWFTLNIFNGTAPLSFFIVFNVMIYWLFISLFWLLFDILIYVPMVIHKWLDKAEM